MIVNKIFHFFSDVTFVDKNIPNDAGFTLTLSQRTQYQQVSENDKLYAISMIFLKYHDDKKGRLKNIRFISSSR